MSENIEDRDKTVIACLTNDPLLRLGLKTTVEAVRWIRLIGQHTEGVRLTDILAGELPHIIVIDTDCSNDATELIRQVDEVIPGARIILLTGPHKVECTMTAIDLKIDGVVLKVQPIAVLLTMIEYLAGQREVVIPRRALRVTPLIARDAPPIGGSSSGNPVSPTWPVDMTERELEVIRLVSEGLTNRETADCMCISTITVRHYLTKIFDKLGVSNRQKLAIRAREFGLQVPRRSHSSARIPSTHIGSNTDPTITQKHLLTSPMLKSRFNGKPPTPDEK